MDSLSLADHSLHSELECAICMNIMTAPCSLKCAHTFCQGCLEETVDQQDGSIRCPLCRKRSFNRDGLVEHKTLRVVCERAREARNAECKHHPGHAMEYYCLDCDCMLCDRCAILGGEHRGHTIKPLDEASQATREALVHAEKDVKMRKQAADALTCEGGRIDAAHAGLLTCVDEVADQAIMRIETLRREARAALLTHAAEDKKAIVAMGNLRAMDALSASLGAQLAALPRLDGLQQLVGEAHDALKKAAVQVPTWSAEAAAEHLHGLPSFVELRRLQEAAGVKEYEASVQIFISQPGSLAFTRTVLPSDTAGQLKASIHERTGLPEDKQCLYYGGKPLDDERTLESQRVTKGATVELRLRVLHEVFHEDSSCEQCTSSGTMGGRA